LAFPNVPTPQHHIDHICASDTFAASPRICSLLRFLASTAIADGEGPPTQEMIAASALNLPNPGSRAAAGAVRVQVGRLRKLLSRYYAGEGANDPLRVELPLRDYRLRFTREGQPIAASPQPGSGAPILVVTETRSLTSEPEAERAAQAFLRNLLTELGGHVTVAMVGPVAPGRFANGAPAHTDARLRQTSSYTLDTSLQPEGPNLRALALLFTGSPPRQIWSQSYTFPSVNAGDGGPLRAAARRLAADVADETGFLVRHILRESTGKEISDYTVVEAITSLWRYWITGSQEDLAFSRQVLDHAVTAAPESPLALGFWVAAACQEYTSNLDPRARLPDIVVARAELARRHALGMPWIELVRCYAMWLSRNVAGLAAALDRLDTVQGSATFRGMLASLRIAADIGPERGRAVLADAIADSPQPLLWFHLCTAIYDMERGDLDAADRALAMIDAPTRPEPAVMRACIAAARGDLDTARRTVSAVIELLPEFATVGEVILRRWLTDRHVDGMATALGPLELDWFHSPAAGGL
jgi:hypothetical protein